MTPLFTLHRLIEVTILTGVTIGPLYMILVPRGETDPRSVRTRRWNYFGFGVLSLALLCLCMVIDMQRDDLRDLEQRLARLEAHAALSGHPASAP